MHQSNIQFLSKRCVVRTDLESYINSRPSVSIAHQLVALRPLNSALIALTKWYCLIYQFLNPRCTLHQSNNQFLFKWCLVRTDMDISTHSPNCTSIHGPLSKLHTSNSITIGHINSWTPLLNVSSQICSFSAKDALLEMKWLFQLAALCPNCTFVPFTLALRPNCTYKLIYQFLNPRCTMH